MNPLQADRWSLAKNRQRLGPFTHEQLKQMAAADMIQLSDMLLEEGQNKWRVAGTIEGIWPQAVEIGSPGPVMHCYSTEEDEEDEPSHESSVTGACLTGAILTAGFLLVVIAIWVTVHLILSSGVSSGLRDERVVAKEKLKIVLDSWLLHESKANFDRKHPEISEWVAEKGVHELLKAEILTDGEKGSEGYVFAVLLTYQSRAGTEIKRNASFRVKHDTSVWTIYLL